jgi:hypothetical protein
MQAELHGSSLLSKAHVSAHVSGNEDNLAIGARFNDCMVRLGGVG